MAIGNDDAQKELSLQFELFKEFIELQKKKMDTSTEYVKGTYDHVNELLKNLEKNMESHKSVTEMEMEQLAETMKMLRETFNKAESHEERLRWFEELNRFHQMHSEASREHKDYSKETKNDARSESAWGKWSTTIVTVATIGLTVGLAVWGLKNSDLGKRA